VSSRHSINHRPLYERMGDILRLVINKRAAVNTTRVYPQITQIV
jgi:hypothetical protein